MIYSSDRRKDFIAFAPMDNRSSFERQSFALATYIEIAGPVGFDPTTTGSGGLCSPFFAKEEQHPVLTRQGARHHRFYANSLYTKMWLVLVTTGK